MERFFKIKLRMNSGPKEVWVGTRARSVGETIAMADTRTMGTQYDICADSAREITPEEYYIILHAVSLRF